MCSGQRILRGQVWWIGKQKEYTGSIQSNNRPYIIISNDIGNRYSPTFMAIPCTTSEKKGMPTHVKLNINSKDNVALCEQIKTFNLNDLENYIFTLNEESMNKIEKALEIALGLNKDKNVYKESLIKDLEENCEIKKGKESSKMTLAEYIEETKKYKEVDDMIDNFKNNLKDNKRRVWTNPLRREFIEFVEKQGIKKASEIYGTGINTKAYYKRFCKLLNIEDKLEKGEQHGKV